MSDAEAPHRLNDTMTWPPPLAPPQRSSHMVQYDSSKILAGLSVAPEGALSGQFTNSQYSSWRR